VVVGIAATEYVVAAATVVYQSGLGVTVQPVPTAVAGDQEVVAAPGTIVHVAGIAGDIV
jgi:hypothetical protein